MIFRFQEKICQLQATNLVTITHIAQPRIVIVPRQNTGDGGTDELGDNFIEPGLISGAHVKCYLPMRFHMLSYVHTSVRNEVYFPRSTCMEKLLKQQKKK